MSDSRFKPLPRTKLRRGVPCYLPRLPEHRAIDANSPALAVMTDFQRVTPVTISRDASLDDANKIMALCRVHYLLIADEQRRLQGIVTEAGTKGHRPLAVAPVALTEGVAHRERASRHEHLAVRAADTVEGHRAPSTPRFRPDETTPAAGRHDEDSRVTERPRIARV